MAENGYGLAGLGMGKVKSVNQYRHAPEAFARLKPASAQKISATYKKQPHHPPSGASGPPCF
ncbi:hypothetical protein [Shigella flexneri]|uniref:hypothetical protein n=1 Tax=Shigella flexneri TaxID=623 RepID=UPI003F54CB56